MLTTGGTIACAPGAQGLEPQNSGVMQFALEQLRGFYEITVRDMTAEAAMTKLMWALGQGMNQQEISNLFRQNLAGEITI